MFPGRIIQANHPNLKVSLTKAEDSWIWPSSVQVTSIYDKIIIRRLNDTNNQRKKGYFYLKGDLLAM